MIRVNFNVLKVLFEDVITGVRVTNVLLDFMSDQGPIQGRLLNHYLGASMMVRDSGYSFLQITRGTISI